MSEFKYCPSCGAALSLNAVFCHSCGQKQKATVSEEAAEAPKPFKPEPILESKPEAEKETVKSAPVDPQTQPADHAQATSPVPQNQQIDQPLAVQPAASRHAAPTQPVAPSFQNAPAHKPNPAQQPYYKHSGAAPAQNAPAPAKKKFPWFFAAVWFILFIAVGIWAYFLMADPNYDRPEFTEEAKRIVLFAAAVAMLIYTLSLKLSVRKLRMLPAALLIMGAVIVFYLFCMVELTEGDMLHDLFSSITDSILPASGE